MTHDTKATLPDASHDAYVRLMAAARRSEPHNGYGEADIVSDELTLRSHIAALEAENKRLRDIIKELVENERRNNLCDPDMLPTERHIEETWEKAKSAIAQTGEKS